MNIFVLDEDPIIAAQYHCNAHVVKMIVEQAQMLSTAHQVIDGRQLDGSYRKTHANHPCNVWIRKSLGNYEWSYLHFKALLSEYTTRYGKIHSCEKFIQLFAKSPLNINQSTLMTPFAQAMPEQYRDIDPVKAYRTYYINDKKHFAKWTNRDIPSWFKGSVDIIDSTRIQ